MTRHSSPMCQRCGKPVGPRSVFVVLLWAKDGKLLHDVIFARNALEDNVLMHASADRECSGEISGYVGKLLKSLELSNGCDTSFLEGL